MLDIHTLPAQMVLYRDYGLPGRGACRGEPRTAAHELYCSFSAKSRTRVRQENRATALSPSEQKRPISKTIAQAYLGEVMEDEPQSAGLTTQQTNQSHQALGGYLYSLSRAISSTPELSGFNYFQSPFPTESREEPPVGRFTCDLLSPHPKTYPNSLLSSDLLHQ